MKRLWLNLSPYNMRLIVVRSAAVTGHKLVVMGSGINQNTAVLESLGFARETGFKNEYWSRPLAGANNALILSKLPAAILEETEIDQIMPTRYGSALARRDVKNSNGGKSNASEPKTQRDAPLERSDADHGLRSHAVAGAGADAPLGADLPSDADGAGPARLMQLSSSGELLKHLMSHHDQMVELELELMREWKLKHPAKENQTMQEAAGRNQQAKMHAKEVIREDMENSIRLYALETSQKA